MADSTIDDQYFTYDGRLASFKPTKKRASTTGGRAAKPLNWPHKRITPASLASAGFFFSPTPDHPDNVICFLCRKGLDGWEEGDDPLQEHLNHTSGCGWATLAAIEAEIGDYHLGDPSAPEMVAARKATFAGKWPHDSKRGWKCKTKQLVESGWKYTPTLESDDMATCVYCQLALDGWEPNDKPLDEHYKRAPNCPFFTLVSQTHGASKKTARAKASRTSKASRASIQSSVATPSEIGSIDELTAAHDDTVLTTTSTMTAGGKKPRAKKATATKAATKSKSTRAKKEEIVELGESQPLVEEDITPQPSPPKAKRGKKRGSDAIDESTLTVAEDRAPKKRATRGRVSKAVESSVIEPSDVDMDESNLSKKPAAKKRGRPPKAQTGRKASTASRVSNTSMASTHADTIDLLNDDEEIERQLQADLERPLTDDEDIMADSDSERFKARAKGDKTSKASNTVKSTNYAMFDPQPVEADDAAVEEELKQLQAEMQVDEPEQLQIPKKGRKAGTRKASKQTKPKKKADPTPEEPEPEAEVEFEDVPLGPEEVENEARLEDTVGSTDTVVHKTKPGPAEHARGHHSKASLESAMEQDDLDVVDLVDEPIEERDDPAVEVQEEQAPVKRPRGRPSKASLASRASSGEESSLVSTTQGAVKRGRGRPKKTENAQSAGALQTKEAAKPQPRKVSRTKKAAPPPAEAHAAGDEIYEEPSSPIMERFAPATPRVITKAHSAKQATVSPSPSPQSSDAENQPPSSKPSGTTTKRIALAPIAETPKAVSPSKRNIIAGLQSATPWTAVDIDAVLGTPRHAANMENGTERLIKKGKELTSPERDMTVEEWVYHNAGQAEKMLKQECEAMVSRFESEGARAMNVLEGLIVD